ncbi:MAG TPA: hypothetical protein VN778_05080 [Verrucomicrobiae bacterium]|nr:hypothetical protein [Verrucomicrobiae bacterium]
MVKKFLGRAREFADTNKTWVVSWVVIILSIFLTIHFWPKAPSPVPSHIQQQAGFVIIYPDPRSYSYKNAGWNYTLKDGSVSFTVKKDGYSVAFNEQQTPLEYQNDVASYNRFIGSLRPSANFNVPLGTVSITNFVTAGDYQVVGKTGILNSQNTLLLAHPDTDLTDNQWRDLFESLQISN